MTGLTSQSSQVAEQGLSAICQISQPVFFPLHQLPQQYNLFLADSEAQTNDQSFNIYSLVKLVRKKKEKKQVQRTFNDLPWTWHVKANWASQQELTCISVAWSHAFN